MQIKYHIEPNKERSLCASMPTDGMYRTIAEYLGWAQQTRPKYAARLEVYVVEDISPASEIGILYPDVEVLQIRQRRDVTPPRRIPAVPLLPPHRILPQPPHH